MAWDDALYREMFWKMEWFADQTWRCHMRYQSLLSPFHLTPPEMKQFSSSPKPIVARRP